jgi:hypothetical protein
MQLNRKSGCIIHSVVLIIEPSTNSAPATSET